MKIEVEIPDKFFKKRKGLEQNIFIFVGMNHVAVKRPHDRWVVKDGECSMCGNCCEGTHIQGMGLPIKNGEINCALLKPHEKKEGLRICAWGQNRPYSCCIGSPRMEPKCTVSWKEGE